MFHNVNTIHDIAQKPDMNLNFGKYDIAYPAAEKQFYCREDNKL